MDYKNMTDELKKMNMANGRESERDQIGLWYREYYCHISPSSNSSISENPCSFNEVMAAPVSEAATSSPAATPSKKFLIIVFLGGCCIGFLGGKMV